MVLGGKGPRRGGVAPNRVGGFRAEQKVVCSFRNRIGLNGHKDSLLGAGFPPKLTGLYHTHPHRMSS